MKTAHVNFKRDDSMKVEDIDELLKTNGFSEYKIVLPRENAASGARPSLRKGFVFIRFATESDVEAFISKMNGHSFMDGSLRISMKNGDKDAYDSTDESTD